MADETVKTAATTTTQPLSKTAQKKLMKLKKLQEKKAAKKAALKEEKRKEGERKRKEWEDSLAKLSEEEKVKLLEKRKGTKKERMERTWEEREMKIEKFKRAKEEGQKIVVDLDFSDLMTELEIRSMVKQITICYAKNGKCSSPCNLWLTGCQGNLWNQLQKISGFDKWLIEKETKPYIEAFQDRKKDLVYLTADSEDVLEELDTTKIYIVGGLVDRNRWKGLTKKKAEEQGIQTAKLPIGNYLKMSSSQVLTVNQVVEILLKFSETKDWKSSFFEVVPQRKISEGESVENKEDSEEMEQDSDSDSASSDDEESEEKTEEVEKKRKTAKVEKNGKSDKVQKKRKVEK